MAISQPFLSDLRFLIARIGHGARRWNTQAAVATYGLRARKKCFDAFSMQRSDCDEFFLQGVCIWYEAWQAATPKFRNSMF